MIKRPANGRGRTQFDWLDSWHSFSFGDYYDPENMGFKSLRVINDDIVAPGKGFGMHPHRDAEIFTYVIEGQLQHKDSIGNGSIIKPGDLQYMSAGRGVMHSEFNPSDKNRVHLLQVWLLPKIKGGEPKYAEKALGTAAASNALTLLFSGSARAGAMEIRADADIYFGKLDAGRDLEVRPGPDRGTWLHVIRGQIETAGQTLRPGDGAAITNQAEFQIKANEDAEFLTFVMA